MAVLVLVISLSYIFVPHLKKAGIQGGTICITTRLQTLDWRLKNRKMSSVV